MVQGTSSAGGPKRRVVVNLVIAAAIGVTASGCAGSGSEASDGVESEKPAHSTEESLAENSEGGTDAQGAKKEAGGRDEGDNLMGAAVGNKQRSWPSLGDKYDDSAHATPGQTSASWARQRPVWTPKNHDGDFPKEADLKESMKQCDKPGSITLDGKTQQQYVNARYLVVNDEAGPTKSVRGVPRGYAHSPQGAVVSAINTMTYGAPSMGDEVGYEAEKQLWATSKDVQKDMRDRRQPFDNKINRAELWEPADGFKVRTCSDNLVVVEIVTEGIDDLPNGDSVENTVLRVPMAWREGDWVPDFSGTGEDQLFQDAKPLMEFTKVDYR